MAGIDNRVVEMQLRNQQFEKNAQQSMKTLDSLKKSLNLDGAAKSLDGLAQKAKGFTIGHIGDSANQVSIALDAMGIIGLNVFNRLVDGALQAGQKIVSALTLDPIKDGFKEYETEMNATKVMVANLSGQAQKDIENYGTLIGKYGAMSGDVVSQLQKMLKVDISGTFDAATEQAVRNFQKEMGIAIDGAVGPETWSKLSEAFGGAAANEDQLMKDINSTLAELNEYADLTIYNFGNMTDAIGKFTSAGVGLKESASTIKGLSNIAAGAGVNNQRLASAYIQVSQALQAGTFRLMDWNSLQNAGLGNQEFRDQLQATAIEMGILNGTVDNFRESLKDGWLTTDVFVSTLSRAADPTNEWGKRLTKAATEVTTFTQLMETLKEGLGTGWSTSLKLIIGDFAEAKTLWTEVNEVLGGLIGGFSDSRNAALRFWKENDGREAIINGLVSAFKALSAIVEPIGKAFSAIFPPQVGKNLLAFSKGFESLMEKFKIGEETTDKIYRIFKGLFSLIKIGGQVFSFFGKVIGKAISIFLPGAKSLSGGLLEAAARLGDFLTRVSDGAQRAQIFEKAYSKVSDALDTFVSICRRAWDAIKTFTKELAKKVPLPTWAEIVALFGRLGDRLQTLSPILSKVKEAFSTAGSAVKEWFASMDGSGLQAFWTKVKEVFGKIGTFIKDTISNITWDDLWNGVGVGLVAALGMNLSGIMGAVKGFVDNAKQGISALDGILSELSGVLKAFQNAINAQALLTVAKALAILAASVIALSFVDPMRLTGATAALVTMFIGISEALKLVTELSTSKLSIKNMIAISGSLLVLSIGLGILASAVATLAKLPVENLLVGLGGVAFLMYIVIEALQELTKVAEKAETNMAGLAFMVGALKILTTQLIKMALVVALLGSMPMENLAKGLVSVAIMLTLFIGALAILIKIAEKSIAALPALMTIMLALMDLAKTILVLSIAVAILGALSWQGLGQGLLGVAALLAMIGVFLKLVKGPQLGLTAVGLLAVALAVGILAVSVAVLGALPFDVMMQGLLGIVGVLLALVVASYAMLGSLPGAIAMGIMAGSLLLLGTAILFWSVIPFDKVMDGLWNLSHVILALIPMSIVLTLISPLLLLAGAAMLVFSVAILALGAGLLLITAGLMAFTAVGLAAVPMLIAFTLAMGSLALMSPILILLGGALVVLGAGMLIGSLGITTLSLALMLFTTAAPVASVAMTAFLAAISPWFEHAGDMAILGAATLALGAGLLVLGAGALVAAVGVALMAGALALLALGFKSIAVGMVMLSAGIVGFPVLERLVALAPDLLHGTFGLAAFGAAALIAGPGFRNLGIGLIFLASSGMGWIPMLMALSKITPTLLDGTLGLGAFGVAAAIAGPGFVEIAKGLRDLGRAGLGWLPQLTRMPGVFKPLLNESLGLAAFGLAAQLGAPGLKTLSEALVTLSGLDDGWISPLEKLPGMFEPLLNEAFGLGAFGIAAELGAPGLVTLADGINALVGSEAGIDILKLLPGAFEPLNGESGALTLFGLAAQLGAPGLVTLSDAIIALSTVPTTGLDILKLLPDAMEPLSGDSAKGLKQFGKAAGKSESFITLATGLNGLKYAEDGINTLRTLAVVIPALAKQSDGLKSIGSAASQSQYGIGQLGGALSSYTDTGASIQALTDLSVTLRLFTSEVTRNLVAFGTAASESYVGITNLVSAGTYLQDFGFGMTAVANGLHNLSTDSEAKFAALQSLIDFSDALTASSGTLLNGGEAFTAIGEGAMMAQSGMMQLETTAGTTSTALGTLDSWLVAIKEDLTSAQLALQTTLEESLLKIEGEVENWKTAGKSLIKDGLSEGISGEKQGAKYAVETIIDAIIVSAGGGDWNSAGANVIIGLVAGMQGRQQSANQAALNVGKSVLANLKAGLGEKSPSKPARDMGDLWGIGLLLGMKPYERLAGLEAESVGEATILSLQNAMTAIMESFDDEFDPRPVITPVLDFSEIQNGSGYLRSLLNMEATRVGAVTTARGFRRPSPFGELESLYKQVPSGEETTYEFVQNITSPKAISASEVYRQTNNMFSQFKMSKGAFRKV